MRTPSKIQLRTKVPKATAEQEFLGRFLNEDSYDTLITGDTDVYAPDGRRIASLVKEAIPPVLYANAEEALRWLRNLPSENRGAYAGGYRVRRKRQDGTASNTRITVDAEGKLLQVRSAIIGYFEATPRMPFCRQTRFTAAEVERWQTIVPLAQHVASVFKARAPERYAAQAKVAAATEPAYVIRGTPFTTLTVNNTVRGACHRDAGDLKEGFGCISAHRIGAFDGFFLVFPEYRIAVDIGPYDLLLFDAHEMHGNTPMKSFRAEPEPERISIVYYYRSGMSECGSPEQEALKARGRIALDDDEGEAADA